MVGDRRMMPGAEIKECCVRFILLSFIFLFTLFSSDSCAQTSQNQTLSITTFFPARYGVYKNPRLVPLDNEPTSQEDKQEGTIYFNKTEQKLYIYNGTQWVQIGSGSSSGSSLGGYLSVGWKIYSGHFVSPDGCGENLVAGHGTQLCTWDAWYGTITFPTPFNNKPQVIVVTERNPDPDKSPCASNMTDSVHAFADQITNTSFRIWGAGSPVWWSECGHPPDSHEATRAHAKVGWIAIGK